jgi:hypothetical protein
MVERDQKNIIWFFMGFGGVGSDCTIQLTAILCLFKFKNTNKLVAQFQRFQTKSTLNIRL